MIVLHNWCTRPARTLGKYDAPELAGIILSGFCTGHPRFPDGHHIDSSEVAKVDGRLVTTRSGTVYRLGVPDPKWRAWLRAQGRPYDAACPIRYVGEPAPLPIEPEPARAAEGAF